MDLFGGLSEAIKSAASGLVLPAPSVAGASDGDGWIWKWVAFEGEERESGRGEMLLTFRPDAFGEKLLAQLVASAHSVSDPSVAWVQTYSVPHLATAELEGEKFRPEFAKQLRKEFQIAWADIHHNLRRLDVVKKRQEEAFQKLRERGIDVR